MRLNEAFISEITARNDVESVISQYVSLRRRGNTLVGLCPFHNEKTGSFTVYPQTNSFYCFGCGVGGDVINFTMRIENLDYMEAVRTLADRSGLQMPTDGYDDSMQKLRLKIYEVNRAAARFFHSKLFDKADTRGLDYFSQERRLSANTIRHFGLGVVFGQFSVYGDLDEALFLACQFVECCQHFQCNLGQFFGLDRRDIFDAYRTFVGAEVVAEQRVFITVCHSQNFLRMR